MGDGGLQRRSRDGDAVRRCTRRRPETPGIEAAAGELAFFRSPPVLAPPPLRGDYDCAPAACGCSRYIFHRQPACKKKKKKKKNPLCYTPRLKKKKKKKKS